MKNTPKNQKIRTMNRSFQPNKDSDALKPMQRSGSAQLIFALVDWSNPYKARVLQITQCAWCKKDIKMEWTEHHGETEIKLPNISHGMCPACREEMETL